MGHGHRAAARSRTRRARRAAFGAAVALAAGGCQSYERRPLDLAAHRDAFLERTPQSADVRSFAAGLAPVGEPLTGGFDPSDGVSCAEAEVIALVFNADLRLARLRAGVTRATAENAGLWEDPSVGVDLTRIVESTPEPWKLFATVGITIPLSGRLEIEKQGASAEHAAELARVAQREWDVRMAVRRAWCEWSALRVQLEATGEFVSRVDQVVSVVDRMEQVGEIARTEARLFRIEKATRAAELAVLEAQAQQAELRLRQLMGMSPEAPLALRADGIGPGRAAAGDAVDTADVAALQRRSPPLAVAAAEYEVAEKSLELEVRKQYPDLEISPGYGREDGQDQVLLGVSLPLPVLNGNRQGIAEAEARREVARAGAEAALEQVLADVRSAEVRLEGATRRRRTLEAQIVPLVDAQYADAREVARLGEVNTLVLLESLTRQQEAKVSLIEATRDEAIAGVDLDALLGPAPEPAPAPAGAAVRERR